MKNVITNATSVKDILDTFNNGGAKTLDPGTGARVSDVFMYNGTELSMQINGTLQTGTVPQTSINAHYSSLANSKFSKESEQSKQSFFDRFTQTGCWNKLQYNCYVDPKQIKEACNPVAVAGKVQTSKAYKTSTIQSHLNSDTLPTIEAFVDFVTSASSSTTTAQYEKACHKLAYVLFPEKNQVFFAENVANEKKALTKFNALTVAGFREIERLVDGSFISRVDSLKSCKVLDTNGYTRLSAIVDPIALDNVVVFKETIQA